MLPDLSGMIEIVDAHPEDYVGINAAGKFACYFNRCGHFCCAGTWPYDKCCHCGGRKYPCRLCRS